MNRRDTTKDDEPFTLEGSGRIVEPEQPKSPGVAVPVEFLPITYSVHEKAIAELKAKCEGLTADTKEGYADIMQALAIGRKWRGAIEKRRKELVRDPLDYQKKVNETARKLTEAIEAVEAPLKAEREKADRAEEEKKRAAELQAQREREEQLRREAEEARQRAAESARQAEEAARIAREAEQARERERQQQEQEMAELRRQLAEAQAKAAPRPETEPEAVVQHFQRSEQMQAASDQADIVGELLTQSAEELPGLTDAEASKLSRKIEHAYYDAPEPAEETLPGIEPEALPGMEEPEPSVFSQAERGQIAAFGGMLNRLRLPTVSSPAAIVFMQGIQARLEGIAKDCRAFGR